MLRNRKLGERDAIVSSVGLSRHGNLFCSTYNLFKGRRDLCEKMKQSSDTGLFQV